MTGWIYALPGSSLGPGLAAGAPPLEALEEQPGPWQAWLLYGPPPLALAALAEADEGDLTSWRQQLQLGGRLKRRHRQRLTLVNTASLTAESRAALLRQLPELQPWGGVDEPWPAELLTLAAQTVLRLDPALRAAYLDLEAEADQPGGEADGAWRQEPATADWLALLRRWGGRDGEARTSPTPRPAGLLRQLRRQQEWLELLNDHEQQLETELERNLATVQAMAALVPTLEAQLGRARRALEQTP